MLMHATPGRQRAELFAVLPMSRPPVRNLASRQYPILSVSDVASAALLKIQRTHLERE